MIPTNNENHILSHFFAVLALFRLRAEILKVRGNKKRKKKKKKDVRIDRNFHRRDIVFSFQEVIQRRGLEGL